MKSLLYPNLSMLYLLHLLPGNLLNASLVKTANKLWSLTRIPKSINVSLGFIQGKVPNESYISVGSDL